MDARETSKILKKIYFWQLISSVFLVVVAYLVTYFFHLSDKSIVPGQTVSVVVTTLSGVMGIAIPIFYRSFFVYRLKGKKQISRDAFVSFEQTLISIALTAPYFLVISILMNMNQTSNMLIAIFSLYAIYYYFPSEKKVLFEMKLFRIKPIKKQE